MEEVWTHLEADATDLGVLNSKIEGTWPKDEDSTMAGGFYTRVGDNLYWVKSVRVEED